MSYAHHESEHANRSVQHATPSRVRGTEIDAYDTPRHYGYEVARQLRERGGEVMLVAVTGWGQAEDKRQAEAAGLDHHLAEPVDFELLQQLLARRS